MLQIKPSFENITVISTNESDESKKYIKTSGIEFLVTSFYHGKLKLICAADVYRVFSVSSEIVLEEERPKLASILGTFETSTGISYLLFFHILCGRV